jgi:glycosyltransferase involved in cell wall biosynthesis
MKPILFILHCGSNTGYAIEPLERLFFEAGLFFTDGNPAHIHFAYPEIDKGPSRCLPAGFKNIICFNAKDKSKSNLKIIAEYCRQHEIKFVLIFDIQPVHPLHRVLRKSGVETIMSYHGAPISGLMPLWKLTLKKLQVALSRSRLDGLIFESEAMAHFATHGRGVPRKMIDIVPLGVDIDKFRPAESDYVYREFNFPSDRKVIFYSGHMERRKGVHVLIGAAIDLLTRRNRKDVCFLLTGNKGNESEQYERMYSGMGIDELIRFGGYRDSTELLLRRDSVFRLGFIPEDIIGNGGLGSTDYCVKTAGIGGGGTGQQDRDAFRAWKFEAAGGFY